jgi:hypothetical protein
MLIIACQKCGTAVRTVGEFGEVQHLVGPGSDWYPDKYPCHKAGCDGTGVIVTNTEPKVLQSLDIVDLTPQEAFVAFHGMGLPTEHECGVMAVDRAFEASPVAKVHARNIKGTGRCAIDNIELEDGTKIFLGCSTHGAVVYRISKPHSYAEVVSD